MPLVVEGKLVDEKLHSVRDLVERFPDIQANSIEFIGKPVKNVGKAGLLYVHQREYATVSPDDEQIKIIGSEDATTCHIVILRHKESGVTSLVHFDGKRMKEGISAIITSITEVSGNKHQPLQLDLHLFGGFLDDRGTSLKITQELFEILHNLKAKVHLCTACITDLNDAFKDGLHIPIIYGVGVNVRTGDVFQSSFSHKGPDSVLRHARTFSGRDKVLEVYSSAHKMLRIEPFDYSTIVEHAASFARAQAEWILKHLSTSPHCEPLSFVDDIRATMQFIADNPSPLETVFPDRTPRTYRVDSNGDWALV